MNLGRHRFNMHFQSQVVVRRTLHDVAAFFDNPFNLAKWDKSVARVEPTSSGPAAVGFTFDTIAPSGMRMSYRIAAHEAERGTAIELAGSKMFKRAVWLMTYDAVADGTKITCEVDFALRFLYGFLIVPLLVTQKSALRRDLSSLKAAIEGSAPVAG
jgi:hypothetical protein